MRLRLISLGHEAHAWMNAGVEEYARRMVKPWPLELVALKADKRQANRAAEMVLASEAERIRAQIPERALTIALDERGATWSTRDLALHLQAFERDYAVACFVIGSADGLDASFKRNAEHRLSLSRMTLPHGLARVLLVEQLYRAVSVINGHPYHRD